MWNKKIIYELKIVFRKIFPKRIYNILPIIKPIKGRALVAYIPDGVLWEDDDERFSGHTNKWESAQIVKILSKLGYVVDAISHDDTRYKKNLKYDLIIDIGNNAFRFSKQYKDARIIIHSTGSHLRYQNQAEITRLKELERRSGVLLKPRRWQIKMTELQYNLGLEIASLVTLIGNDVTLSTYPQNIQKKIVKIPVTGSSITYVRDLSNIKFQSEYLWFAGSGAVHKGLDLVIDVFKSIENVRLHIIGSYQSEDDFINLYGNIIKNSENIIGHGYMNPSSNEFQEVIKSVKAFILPSCSEAISTAAVTCMQNGIIPIISKNVGIDLPHNCGYTLDECSLKEIKNYISIVESLGASELIQQSLLSRKISIDNYSRDIFREAMTNALNRVY